ncbi:hypothetical protein FI667_g8188, partial [Globisporangium splendens]
MGSTMEPLIIRNHTKKLRISSRTMADAQKEIEKLHEQIHKGTEETKTYLESLKAKLSEYDEHYKVSETATSYLQAGIDRAHKSVDELKELGDKLKQKSSDKKETLVDATKASFEKVHAALESLKQNGREYDQKFKATLSTSFESAKGGVGAAASTVSSSVESIVSTTREKTVSSFEQIRDQIANVQKAVGDKTASVGHNALVAAGGVLAKAEELDERFGVRTTITGAVAAVTEKVVDLDKSLGVSETAAKVDEKVSGGIGASLLNKGLELVSSSVEYVTDAINHAKETAAAEAQKTNSSTDTDEETKPAAKTVETDATSILVLADAVMPATVCMAKNTVPEHGFLLTASTATSEQMGAFSSVAVSVSFKVRTRMWTKMGGSIRSENAAATYAEFRIQCWIAPALLMPRALHP